MSSLNAKTNLPGMVEGGRKIDRPKRNWVDAIYEWNILSTRRVLQATCNIWVKEDIP